MEACERLALEKNFDFIAVLAAKTCPLGGGG